MRRALACAAALLGACTATIPEGQLTCAADGDCPPEWSCLEGYCYSRGRDAAASTDAGSDAGRADAGPRDAGPRDAGPRDAGRDAGRPPDAGDAEPPPDAGAGGPLVVAAGGDHSCVLFTSGRVFCWGDNTEAQLGSGTPTTGPVTRARRSPRRRPASCRSRRAPTTPARARARACGAGAATPRASSATAPTPPSSPRPRRPCCRPTIPSSISPAGGNVTCVAHESGAVRCWGQDYFGVLGRSSTLTAQRTPVVVSGATGAVQVAVSGTHACSRNAAGEVRCWGNNTAGQLGRGTTSTLEYMPATVDGLTASDLALGLEHSCATTSAGLSCWGENDWGQLGDDSRDDATSPLGVPPPPGAPIGSISGSGENRLFRGGGSPTCAVGAEPAGDGGAGALRLYCWGATGSGRLGIGPTFLAQRQLTPELVLDVTTVTHVDAGHEHTCAVTADGAVWCWGNNARGQLGNLSTTGSDRPVRVADLP
ncbi:MAG: hypothetical protein M5U28_07820 [Sandaracinaceae bacterium]|nr:hypothetical protein [Sandaracinaceae bacterium]